LRRIGLPLRKGFATLPLLLLCFLIFPAQAAAQATPGQIIRGRVLVAGDTVGLEGVELTLVDSAGVAISRSASDERGRFILRVPVPGHFVLRGLRLGFGTVRAPVTVREKEVVEVDLRMAMEAIRLDPLEVTARRQIRQGTLDEFYDRMARMKEKGRGQFLTLEDIEKFGGMEIALLIQTLPGVWARYSGAGNGYSLELRSLGRPCSPDIYLDGLLMGMSRNLYPGDLEGVEVYRGPFEPVDGYWISRCGAIFLWRKKDWGIPLTVKNFILAAIGGTLWFLLPTIF
jgi:hypothetical protein